MSSASNYIPIVEAVRGNPDDEGNWNSFYDLLEFGSLQNRREVQESGAIDFCVEYVKANSSSPFALNFAWDMINKFIIIDDVDDPEEYGPDSTASHVANLGIIEVIAECLQQADCNVEVMFDIVSWMAQEQPLIPKFVSLGVHKMAISILKSNDENLIDSSLAVIRAFSALEGPTRKIIREDGGLDAVLPFIGLLGSENELELRRGFRSGSIVARLAGNDETGVGVQILRGNPILISKTVEILDRVYDAGPTGTVINMGINPHLITMDLLVIATSDVNKPLLKDSIPVLVKGLKMRGSNERMVIDIVKILLQLTYDPSCLKLLHDQRNDITSILSRLIVPPQYDLEARMALQNLVNVMQQETSTEKPKTAAPSKFAGIVRRVVSANKTGGEKRKSSSAATDTRHVMLSYNWGIKPLIEKIDQMLRDHGVKVWVDYREMGPNLNDSMANAIEGAMIVFVFMTSKYKESANCRKECEYADGQGT